jgi:predicted dinucleotide-binding enzyme
MKIAVIGAGPVGRTLGAGWAAKRHEVRYGARNLASDKVAKAVAATPGSQALPIAEAVRWAEAAVLATPWEGARPAVSGVDFAGKPLLDATNPLAPGFEIAIGHTSSGGEQVQAWAPSASVVKIFNSTGAENMANPVYPQGRAAMVHAGGDTRAKAVAAQLAADLGFEPLDLGGLETARFLEPAAMVWIKLAIVQRLGRDIAFGLMRR